MLSRSKAVIRLIKIRKLLEDKEKNLVEPPDTYHKNIKNKLDKLLIDIIGVPQEGQHQVNNILKKAISGQIKARTAVVAVHEIYNDYQNKNDEKTKAQNKIEKKNNKYGIEQLYKSGYR